MIIKKSKNVTGFTISILAAAVMIMAAAPRPVPAADLFLKDEPEIYAAIDKLNALGYLPGFLANTRPYSMRAVRAAIDNAHATTLPEGFDAELMRWVSFYSAPKTMGRASASAAFSDVRFLPPNNEGIPRPDGWSVQGALSLREEKLPHLSGQLRAVSFRGEGGDDGNRLLDASVEGGHRYASFQAGKISTWYGPGRTGSLILTDNAEPYPGVRVHNVEPITTSGWGWFSFLGNIQYDFFAARMEKKPVRSRSTFVGTRLAARPKAWLEVGLTRVLHYGGEGRSDGISEFLSVYGGDNDPSDRSNTLAGFDVTLNLPFKAQPVQAYWDRAGEGENRFLGTNIPFPGQRANLFGVYLPKLLGNSRLDMRAEYADVYSRDAKTAGWYSHIYPHFYRGDVLGHPMGGGSREWSLQSRYFYLPSSFAEVTYEKILHDRGIQSSIGFDGERRTRLSAGVTGWLAQNWRAEARTAVDRLENEGGVRGTEGSAFSAFLGVAYQTSSIFSADR